jgi:thiol-disulfide isomerase/thioredoxin
MNIMKKTLGLICLLATAAAMPAVGIGDTYEHVVGEKGAPVGRAEAGNAQILRYPDMTIRLRAGKVIAVDPATPAPRQIPATPAPQAASAPAAPPASIAPAQTPASPKAGTAPVWLTDYAAALAQGKEQKRNIFLFFTGSDWCGWCIRLKKEILATPEFAHYAREHLVLVELDFPRGKPLPPVLKSQNASLAQQYRIQGFPTVIVLNPAGTPVGRLGYQEGGPGPFVARLKGL